MSGWRRCCRWWPSMGPPSSPSPTTKAAFPMTPMVRFQVAKRIVERAADLRHPARRCDHRSAGDACGRCARRRRACVSDSAHGERGTGLQHHLRRLEHLLWPAQPSGCQRPLCEHGHRRRHDLRHHQPAGSGDTYKPIAPPICSWAMTKTAWPGSRCSAHHRQRALPIQTRKRGAEDNGGIDGESVQVRLRSISERNQYKPVADVAGFFIFEDSKRIL